MSHPMRFLVLSGVLVILGGCSDTPPTAPAAHALTLASGKPTRSPVSNGPFEFPAGLVCSFAVAGEVFADKEFATTFPPKPNGDVVQLITGRLMLRLTNVSTGKSITANVSGPGRFTFHADGSATFDILGPFGPFTDVQSGKFVVFSGRLVVEVTPPNFLSVIVSQNGHEEDVCAALS